MINYDTLFDDENKDILAKLEAESAGILGRLDNKERGSNTGIEALRTNGSIPKFESPFGKNSIFFNGGDGGYVTFVNFKKLIPFLIDYKGQILPYYYRFFESHASIVINEFSSIVPSTIERDDDKNEGVVFDDEDPLIKKVRKALRDIIVSTIEKRVDEEYIGKDGKAIFLDGKLNTKEGFIKMSRDAIGFLFKLDAPKRKISFIDCFYYVDEKTGVATKEWAIQIEAYNYEYYNSMCGLEGFGLTEDSILFIVRKFTEALNEAREVPSTMAWLYFKMPEFVFLQRNKTLLIDDLATILQGDVNEDAIHTEATVLKILQAFVTDNKADQDNLLYELTTRYIKKETLFEVLYDKMNDTFGADNWTAAIQLLYKVWSASLYADEKNYEYTGQPERLAYQSKKVFGFYLSGFDFSFENGKIKVDRIVEEYYGEKRTFKNVYFTTYSMLQPIGLNELNQDGELKIDSAHKIPAFYLKAFNDKNKWANFEKEAWLGFDILMTISAVGNLAKLRYLTYLSKTAFAVRLVSGSLFLASSLTQTMLNFVNDCSAGTFCEKLKTYLFWLDLATISLDAITERMLRKSAREALDEMGEKIGKEQREIKEHLEEVAGNFKIKSGSGGILKYKKILSRNVIGQEESMSCAAACIRQFAKDANILKLESEVRTASNTTKFGTSDFGIKSGLEEIFVGKTINARSFFRNTNDAMFPTIIKDISNEGKWIGNIHPLNSERHAVIVDKVIGNEVYIRDPWPIEGIGKSKFGVEAIVNLEEFAYAWLRGGAVSFHIK